MTNEEFKDLKVNDVVYLPKTKNRQLIGTVVLEIDRIFKKVRVLLGKKFYSYKYIPAKSEVFPSVCVGVMKQSYEQPRNRLSSNILCS